MAETVTDIVTGQWSSSLAFVRTDTQQIGTVRNSASSSGTYTFSDGSGTGQADLAFGDTRTIAANTVEEIDLLNLDRSHLGVTVPMVFRQLVAVRIKNNETAAGKKLLVGVDPGSPTTSYAFEVGPGMEVASANTTDGWVVTNTNSTLRLANPNNTELEYEIFLLGNSTAVGGSGL